jgi:hypothetical protein
MASATTTLQDDDLEHQLIELDERVLTAYILRSDSAPLREISRDDYFVMGPAGVEPKAHVLATVGNLDVHSLRVENHTVQILGASAVLAGFVHAEGELGGHPMPTLGYLSMYVREDSRWRLAARSLTPQFVQAPPP